jgi:hypothetical protein
LIFVLGLILVQTAVLAKDEIVPLNTGNLIWFLNPYSGLLSLGVPGVPWHTQILVDQLTLFQPGGTDYAHPAPLIGQRLSSYPLLSDVHCPGQIPKCHTNIFCSFFHVM